MTGKQFLRGVRCIDRRIDRKQEQVDRLRARLEAGRLSAVTGMPRGGGADWTQTADRLIELEKRLNADIRRMCRMKQAAMDAIGAIEEIRLREVLEYYYLDGMTWEQVAEAMGYSQRQVFRLHGIALRRVAISKDVIECQY